MRSLNFDFIGRRRIWFIASGVLVLIAAVSLLTRGLNLSIEFRGGSSFTISGISEDVTDEQLEEAAVQAGAEEVTAQLVREGDRVTGAIVRTEEIEPGTPRETEVSEALQDVSGAERVEAAFVGPTFGERISQKMLQALIVFLAVTIIYITVRLEFKMAVAALAALVHDLVLTAGVYSIFDFNVSPATVIALLTILGYSLYDTVIVFDRVKEAEGRIGTAGHRTISDTVNTAQNDVFWRSINTTITSILPVGALLFIGARALGAATLEDVALALFVGMLLGAYSSLFIAGPILALWREREPEMIRLRERAERRRDRDGDEESATVQPRRRRDEEDLAPREYVRGPGRTPRRRRR